VSVVDNLIRTNKARQYRFMKKIHQPVAPWYA